LRVRENRVDVVVSLENEGIAAAREALSGASRG
jgi:hypothetical protein